MKRICWLVLVVCATAQAAQTQNDTADYKMALPNHNGQLQWHADDFQIVQSSVKPKGVEIGIRGENANGRSFLGFLFLFPEQAPMTSAKCRDGIMTPVKKQDPELMVLKTSEIANIDGQQVEVVRYEAGDYHNVRAFIATGDICGDLEFYSRSPLSEDDSELNKIIASFRFNPNYVPQVNDVVTYGQMLYRREMFKDAAPLLEQAIAMLKASDPTPDKTALRVLTDNAGMAWGISGNLAKARAVFDDAIQNDPDYPLNYYNLACADAEEGKLADARTHLTQAFARKANVIPGEKLPDPTTDDSFLPYKSNKEFWSFLQGLH
jgi:tetratricopeptide (TPR) repeat protein